MRPFIATLSVVVDNERKNATYLEYATIPVSSAGKKYIIYRRGHTTKLNELLPQAAVEEVR